MTPKHEQQLQNAKQWLAQNPATPSITAQGSLLQCVAVSWTRIAYLGHVSNVVAAEIQRPQGPPV